MLTPCKRVHTTVHVPRYMLRSRVQSWCDTPAFAVYYTAGDWDAAAAAIKLLSMDVQHHLELLVVRSERGSRHRMPEADKSLARSLEADNKAGAGGAVVSGLRQRLVLIDAAQYASAAGITSDPLVGVR